MEDRQLPEELERIEQELIDRPSLRPPDDLRERVSDAVRAELQRKRPGDRWAFAAAVAAAVVVWINLSLSATQATDCRLSWGDRPLAVEAAARQIRELLPEVSDREAMRQAILLQSGSNLAWCPNPVGRPLLTKSFNR